MAKKSAKPFKAHCPKCDGDRSCDVHGETNTSWDWEDRQGHSMSGGADHNLLQCRGCETVFYRISSWDSESLDYYYDEDGNVQIEPSFTVKTYPTPDSKNKPTWVSAIGRIDLQIEEILNETYSALDNKLYILSAIGLRTALDRATDLLKIDPSISFDEKLIALKDGGWIGDTEKAILEVVTDAGSAAAHRGWRPDATELAYLFSAMEIFLQKAFIVEKKALSIKDKIPPKPKRQKKLRSQKKSIPPKTDQPPPQ